MPNFLVWTRRKTKSDRKSDRISPQPWRIDNCRWQKKKPKIPGESRILGNGAANRTRVHYGAPGGNAGWQQSTGLLHLHGFESVPLDTKKEDPRSGFSFLVRVFITDLVLLAGTHRFLHYNCANRRMPWICLQMNCCSLWIISSLWFDKKMCRSLYWRWT